MATARLTNDEAAKILRTTIEPLPSRTSIRRIPYRKCRNLNLYKTCERRDLLDRMVEIAAPFMDVLMELKLKAGGSEYLLP